ncbi:conserved hypothetical protein, partial [Ricinus communis]
MVQSWIKPVLWLACLLSLQAVHAHETHPEHSASALTVSVTADHGGRVWLAQVKQGQVWVSVSDDAGKYFSTEVAVNPVPMTIAADAEARPNIAAGANGAVYVTWTEALKKNHAGNIWFARSLDGGKKFEAPYIVHQHREEITH